MENTQIISNTTMSDEIKDFLEDESIVLLCRK